MASWKPCRPPHAPHVIDTGVLSPGDELTYSRSQWSGQKGSEPNVLAVHLRSPHRLVLCPFASQKKGEKHVFSISHCLLAAQAFCSGKDTCRWEPRTRASAVQALLFSGRLHPSWRNLLGEGDAFSPLSVEARLEDVWVT